MNKRKIIIPAFIIFVSASTSIVFQKTQSFYIALAQGDYYWRRADYATARVYYQNAFHVNPRNLKSIASLIRAYRKLNMKNEILIVLNQAQVQSLQNPRIAMELAGYYYEAGLYAQAEDIYEALKYSYYGAEARQKLAEVLVWQQKYKEAIPYLSAYARRHSADLAAQEFLADVYAWSRDYDNAIRQYKKLIPRLSNPEGVVLKLADILRFAGRNEEAIEVYNTYLQGAK